ncbi:MAG: sporulation protein YqfD [Oscillospiraceae bacterium]|nr:sporulation protein YqfD [Oscillospiraceae bacterium]
MLKNIRGIVSFEASGDNLYKFINAVREKHIVCTSQRCKDGVFYAQIYCRDISAVQETADRLGIGLKIINKKGLRFRMYAYRFRFGIIIGIALVLGFVFYLSNTVVTIEVCGNSEVTDRQVIAALENIGIYKGRFIPDIDFHSCEQKLRLSIPQISWTGIRHTGSRIVVDITEAVESPEMVNDDIPCNIIAAHDAQITYAEVYAGKLSRKIGDGVKKGDIIISGTITDGGGNIIKKHAMGKVRGIYKEQVTFSQPLEEDSQVYSDDIQTRKYFDFFGFRIPMFFSDVECKTYDYNENVTKFRFSDFEIPLGIVYCNYHPFSSETVTYTQEEAEIMLEQQTALHEKNFYDSKETEILERKIEKNITDEKIEYKISYTLEGDIGIDWEIYVD